MRAGKIGRAGALAVATAAGVAVFATGGASADENSAARAPEQATIKMVLDGKDVFFTGAGKVEHGGSLKIVNTTDPEEIGPHTFTLVKERLIPDTKQEMKECERGELEVCNDVMAAHKVNFETFEVGRPSVDAREDGWDKSFGNKGDSWYTGQQGEKHKRNVSAEAGKTLHYFCVIHPFMHGQIKVK